MPHLCRVTAPPKGRSWKVEVDGRTIESEDTLMEFVHGLITADAFYYKTNFKDPKTHKHASSRQRNFSDGYWVYTFWFTKVNDAALMKLMHA